MRIGVPRASRPGETRVAATPGSVRRLIDLGHQVALEAGAGELASAPDSAYLEVGAELVDRTTAWSADVVLTIAAPTPEEIALLRRGAVLAALLNPAGAPELLDQLAQAGVTALAMDAVPRISRAQSLDVLSSMANIGGYRAVVEAAHQYGSPFTGQVTAAGTVPPAKVFVIGAGVAGLAAIGTASSMGAVVRAFDVRPEVAEQVESMGAEFVQLDLGEQDRSADGYARELSEDLARLTAQTYAEEAAQADIVITTALIPGRQAPLLLDEAAVSGMRPGSVIVDMAAGNGGNCELTRGDEIVRTAGGVTIVGYTDLPARLPEQASRLYAANVANLLTLLTPQRDGELVLDLEDEVQRGLTVAHQGEVLWPPPPVSVSVAPAASGRTGEQRGAGVAGADADEAPAAVGQDQHSPARARDPRRLYLLMAAAGLAFLAIGAVSPPELLSHLTVFALAVIVGFYVITNVTHALHTPLLSETNAISAIILIGALLQVSSDDPVIRWLAVVAVTVASINVFGGFAVTGRMLAMFRTETAGDGPSGPATRST